MARVSARRGAGTSGGPGGHVLRHGPPRVAGGL